MKYSRSLHERLKAGAYYVSVRDGERYGLLLGPYATHAQALAMVQAATDLAREVDPRAPFYSYGTCRLAAGTSKPGILNALHAARRQA